MNKLSLIASTVSIALLCCAGSPKHSSEELQTLRELRNIQQTKEIKSFYEGLFNKVGVIVLDRGHQFTFTYADGQINFDIGFDSSEVDFVVPLHQENVENLIEFSSDGRYDEAEATRITAALFRPFTKTNLMKELSSSSLKVTNIGLENLMHIHLVHSDGSIVREYSIAHSLGEWYVMEGLQGHPHREFTLTYRQALNFHRQMFHAVELDTKRGWRRFFRWYYNWHDDYSVAYED